MPLYEFVCPSCGLQFEDLVNSDVIPACPACGCDETEKLLSCCARRSSRTSGDASDYAPVSGGGCGSCSGGNCAACGR